MDVLHPLAERQQPALPQLLVVPRQVAGRSPVARGADDSYVLADLGSTNGTRLNGVRIREPVMLSEGDKIFLGSTIVKFGWADELDARYHARLETLAATDALTGLLSSRKFDGA